MIAAKVAATAAVGAGAAYAMTRKDSAVLGLSRSGVFAASPASAADFGVMYYVKAALAGGICCGVTHGAMTVRAQLSADAEGGFRDSALFKSSQLSANGVTELWDVCWRTPLSPWWIAAHVGFANTFHLWPRCSTRQSEPRLLPAALLAVTACSPWTW
jgi:hypothetical protein